MLKHVYHNSCIFRLISIIERIEGCLLSFGQLMRQNAFKNCFNCLSDGKVGIAWKCAKMNGAGNLFKSILTLGWPTSSYVNCNMLYCNCGICFNECIEALFLILSVLSYSRVHLVQNNKKMGLQNELVKWLHLLHFN